MIIVYSWLKYSYMYKFCLIFFFQYYYGLYDFTPTGPNQLSLKKGQVVLVLHKCDLNQNSEWWFVEDRHGNKGYVPRLYLNKYSKDVA